MKPATRLAEMLTDYSSGWIEAIDTAMARGTAEAVLIKATQRWFAGAYDQADLLVTMGEIVDYTVVTDKKTLASVLTPLADADVVAIDTETHAPSEVRLQAECAGKRIFTPDINACTG